MPTYGPLNTPYEDPGCAVPAAGDATTKLSNSGVDLSQGSDKPGLVSSPFMGNSPFTSPPAQSPTPNMSELPNPITYTGPLEDAPAPGTQIEIAGGVTSPNIPAPPLKAR